ncbi:superoxide dismutase family protein [Sphingomonas tabacisoli]|uniref:Superoxide dismutase [Cu-Zn] n=1 Tax=Sphingomonas tabacisoli TaxID=2249466 RepID=A0ABW4I0M0_9SPHN
MTAKTVNTVTDYAAHADLQGSDGISRGRVLIGEAGGPSVAVLVQAEGLPAGTHGIHIHTVGRCDAPDFQTAGGHWNPTGKQHGRDNPMGAHEGDLPNIEIGADGRGNADFTVAGATLAALLDADGAAIVIHASADDYRTDPSGNSGARIACGVISR